MAICASCVVYRTGERERHRDIIEKIVKYTKFILLLDFEVKWSFIWKIRNCLMYNSLLDEYETTQVEGTKKRRQLQKKITFTKR